jgi:hypothetical protein
LTATSTAFLTRPNGVPVTVFASDAPNRGSRVTITLKVVVPAGSFDYTLSNSVPAGGLTLAHGTTSAPITVTATLVSGVAEPVTLSSITIEGPGQSGTVTASTPPGPITPAAPPNAASSTTFTLTAIAGAKAGTTYTVTVTGFSPAPPTGTLVNFSTTFTVTIS